MSDMSKKALYHFRQSPYPLSTSQTKGSRKSKVGVLTATYVTQWKYDSHNRLLEMIYPDEEKVTYSYNLGGQVDHVRGYKAYGYDYVNKIGYDKFVQRSYLKYCNGAETFYSYDPTRRRLQNLVVNTKAGTIMDNAYSYDAVSNVLGIKNNAPLPQSGKAGGQMSYSSVS